MKRNFNVIQIRGFRGIVMAGFIVICLAVGFIAFPGWVCMHLWNYISTFTQTMPAIGVAQGLLLWGILAVSYFLLRKNRLVVCFRAPESLSEEELREVYSDIKKHSESDPVLQAMMKAKEAEIKAQIETMLKENEKAEKPAEVKK